MMTRYHHRQVGTLILIVVGAAVVVLALLLSLVDANPVGIAVLLVLLVCLGLFWGLTVEVTERDVLLKFGFGLVRKRFPLAAIRGARTVRNRWYFGWGIRLLPKGWLFNVSGLDAIEIQMADNSVHRIGTDEPSELLKAIADGLRGRSVAA